MTDVKRKQTIDSWHLRADAYEELVHNHQIFTDMSMVLIEFVEKNLQDKNNVHIIDLAAGTGLVSRLLIEHVHLSPSSLYLIEPAERMCVRARDNIKTPHVYQIAAEDCLSINDLPRNYFDFILCNASMHLMSESDIYPIVSKLLKPNKGYFLYTLWYHAFDQTQCYDQDDEFEKCVNDAMEYFNYPKYFTEKNPKSSLARSKRYLEETAYRNGLYLESCKVNMHQIPLSFHLDFMLMSPNCLIDHLKKAANNDDDVHSIKERIIEKIRELINDKYTDKPIVQIIVSKK